MSGNVVHPVWTQKQSGLTWNLDIGQSLVRNLNNVYIKMTFGKTTQALLVTLALG